MNISSHLTRHNLMIGGGVVAALLVLGVGGWFLFSTPRLEKVEFAGQTLRSADICNAALILTTDYGVVPSDSELTEDTSSPGDAENRVICYIKSDGFYYEASLDLICPQMQNLRCIDLYKVENTKGEVLFHRVS